MGPPIRILLPYHSHGNGGSHYCRSCEVFVDRSNIFFKHAILTTYTWRMIPIGKWSITMVIRSHPSRANVGPRDHSWPNSLHGLRCDGGRLPPNTFKRWSWRNNIFILANFYVWSVITLAPFRKSTLLGLWKSKPCDQSWGHDAVELLNDFDWSCTHATWGVLLVFSLFGV